MKTGCFSFFPAVALSFMAAFSVVRPGSLLALALAWEQADVILSDVHRTVTGPMNARGDFNGDGRNDLALAHDNQVMIVLGKNLPPSADFDAQVDWSVRLDMTPPGLGLGDINGDGFDDLVLGFPTHGTGKGRVSIVFGRPGTGTLDLTLNPADVTILGTVAPYMELGRDFAFGDFNGDGIQDALISADPAAYVLWGSSALPALINSGNWTLTTLSVEDTGIFGLVNVAAGDTNGDGFDDAVISAPKASVAGNPSAGVVYVVRGGSPFNATVDVRINGYSNNEMFCPAVGRFDGDAPADFLLGHAYLGYTHLLPQSFIPVGSTNVVTNPYAAGYVPGVRLLGDFASGLTSGDFDGDGRQDAIGVTTDFTAFNGFINGHLSSAFSAAWTPGGFIPTSLFVDMNGVGFRYSKFVLGDFNGDGFDDLIVKRTKTPFGPPPPSQLVIFYGFPLLLHPAIQVTGRPTPARADLALSVDGEPVEMKLDGDIVDPFRGQWIPFAPAKAVTLSAAPGPKTVSAVFRNALKRESDRVQETLSLNPSGRGVVVVDNRVQRGGRAVVECTLSRPGRLKATVWTAGGERLKDLVDEERGVGVWTVEWDGTNNAGRRVAAGVYILRTEWNDATDQKKILVQD